LHFPVHPVQPQPEWLVAAGPFDVVGDAGGFEVWEVLLYTSAPPVRRDRTKPLASAPVAARNGRMPLRSSASAAVAICSSEASSVNSADTAVSGFATAGGSATAHLRQPPVDERHGH
jgi:hypothetical protein